jgi:DNA-binding LytR/AlgR family response regulator
MIPIAGGSLWIRLRSFTWRRRPHDTVIRLRGKRLLRDGRGLGELEGVLRDHYLLRVQRNFIVNLRRTREIRARKEGGGWELRLEPPVNRIIPIGRTYEPRLWKAFED